MTIDQLRYVAEMYQEGTISAAAEKLNISHTAISRAITNLEDELGINIFIRSRNGSELTEQGKVVLESASKVLSEVKHLYSLSSFIPESRTIYVKAFPIDSMLFIPDVIEKLQSEHSHITVNISHANVSEIIQDLKNQKIDFGLVALPHNERENLGPNLKTRLLFESQFMIACSGNSELAKKEIFSAQDIHSLPFIMHSDPLIIKSLHSMFDEIGFPRVLSYSNDNSLIKSTVARGGVLSIYTKQLEQYDPLVSNGSLVLRPFECKNNLDKVDFLCLYNDKKQLQEEAVFIKYLQAATSYFGL